MQFSPSSSPVYHDRPYLGLLGELVNRLEARGATANRTAVNATKVPVRMMRFDLSDGTIPLLTTKKIHWPSVVHELRWFLLGETNNEWLREHGVSIWNEWATPEDVYNEEQSAVISPKGDLGPLYGQQWRRFPAGDFFMTMNDGELTEYYANMEPKQSEELQRMFLRHTTGQANLYALRSGLSFLGIDQISQALYLLKTQPNSRRNIVTAWNPQVVPSDNISPQDNVLRGRAALAACHTFFQFITEPLTEEERYAEFEKSYANHAEHEKLIPRGLLKDNGWSAVAQANGQPYPTHRLNMSFYCRSQDTFLGTPFNIASYALLLRLFAHVTNMVPGELVWIGGDVHLYANHLEQANAQLAREPYPSPRLEISPRVTSLFDFNIDDLTLVDYQSHARIKAEVAV